MAKKPRRQNRPEAARYTPIARTRPAASHVWADLAYRDAAPTWRPIAMNHRFNPHRLVRGLTKAPQRPIRAFSFGTWYLPPTPTPERLKAASTCARRFIRREVLFATKSTGAGSRGRRLHFTNRRC